MVLRTLSNTSATGREAARPRTMGMMQKVQKLSQPS